jgi:hypothetical protein
VEDGSPTVSPMAATSKIVLQDGELTYHLHTIALFRAENVASSLARACLLSRLRLLWARFLFVVDFGMASGCSRARLEASICCISSWPTQRIRRSSSVSSFHQIFTVFSLELRFGHCWPNVTWSGPKWSSRRMPARSSLVMLAKVSLTNWVLIRRSSAS